MPVYHGTNGDNVIQGSAGGDTIHGYAGNDFLQGDDGADTLYGGDDNDILMGSAAIYDSYVDSLYGGNGDDILYFAHGDNADGGSGYDRFYVYYLNVMFGLTVDFSAIWSGGTVYAANGVISNMEEIEVVYGTAYSDTFTLGGVTGTTPELYGMQGADILIGGAGDDWIESFNDLSDSGSEVDTLYGLDGNDLLSGGIGDYLNGGNGIDALALDLTSAPTGVYLDFAPLLAGATATIFGTTLVSFEHVRQVTGTSYADTIDVSADNYSTWLNGGGGNDVLIGNIGANNLNGGTGIDTMIGGAGDDIYHIDDASDVVTELAFEGNDIVYASVNYIMAANIERLQMTGTAALNGRGNALDNVITGNSGANDLRGGTGDDLLIGNDGADRLRGEAGRDIMTGGNGADSFIFATMSELAGTTTATADLITDFNRSQGDLIRLDTIDAIAGGADDAFAFIGAAAFTGVAGQLRYEITGGSTTVYGDVDGDGIADFAIALTGSIALAGSDFVL